MLFQKVCVLCSRKRVLFGRLEALRPICIVRARARNMGEYSAHTPDAGGGHAALADERGTGRTGLTAPMLGFGCGMDEEGQVVVTCVLQGSPAAYCGQVGIGDVIEAIDSRMVSSLQQLSDTASGPVRIRHQHPQLSCMPGVS